jgi:predicted HAD superfamily Cof-like phosphohydrolase
VEVLADLTPSEMLAEFHRVFAHPADTDELRRSAREVLHAEEHDELQEALAEGERLHIAREAADVVYVSYGTAHTYRVDLATALAQHPGVPSADRFGRRLQAAHTSLMRDLRARNLSALSAALAELVLAVRAVADEHRIDLDVAVAEVHRANMSKLGSDGRPMQRPDGKVIKGPNFRAPDMTAALAPAGA